MVQEPYQRIEGPMVDDIVLVEAFANCIWTLDVSAL